MCDKYSKVTGYICYECFEELSKTNPLSEKDVIKFMKTQKNESYIQGEFSLEKMFGN